MKILTRSLLGLHLLALGLGLFGILVAIPHAADWTNPGDVAFFVWAMPRTGWLGMASGALAMFVWGVAALGWKRTCAFAAIAIVISASAELTGTKTGWPFGGYEYLTLLGWKIAGRVPFGVPLSWFYMGFAAYVLACSAIGAARRYRSIVCVLFATWLLTSWDLVLDPAMAALPQIKFWEWHEHGPYYGMPLRNLAGWFGTGLTFIALSAWSWRGEPNWRKVDLTVPFAVFVANIIWSMILALSAGIVPPVVACVALSLVPAALAMRPRRVAAADAI
jgi:putative membrane protein